MDAKMRRGRPLLGDLGVKLERRGRFGRTLVLGEKRDLAFLLDALRVHAAAHRALAFEDHTFVNDQTRARDVAEYLARSTNLELLAGGDIASDPAMHDYGRPVDLGVHDGALADNEGVLGRYLTLDLPLDPDRTFEDQLSRNPTALAEKGARGTRLPGLGSIPIALEHRHLPGDRTSRGWHRGFGANSPGLLPPLTVLPE